MIVFAIWVIVAAAIIPIQCLSNYAHYITFWKSLLILLFVVIWNPIVCPNHQSLWSPQKRVSQFQPKQLKNISIFPYWAAATANNEIHNINDKVSLVFFINVCLYVNLYSYLYYGESTWRYIHISEIDQSGEVTT